MHIFSQTLMPRLGLPQLLTIARQMGHECEIYCEEIAAINWERIRHADMILISSTTSTVPRAYSLIRKIKDDFNSNAPILMGGPHVTFLPEEALEKGADYVFRHEADNTFPAFLNWWRAGKDLSELMKIDGISFRVGDGYHHTPKPHRVDLDTLPTPDLDLIVGFGKPGAIPMITSRGCPWDCDFCSEVSMFGRAFRFRSEEKVIEDIRYYSRRYGKIAIFFADDNLAANQARLERLCREIIANGLVRSYSGQIRLDLAKQPKTLSLMFKAGFERAYIGYESTNAESLEAIGKGLNAKDMAKYTRIIHSRGLEIHAMWVLGFDTDTIATVKDNIRAAIKWKIETNQFLILVPIPGSRMYEKFKKDERIFNRDWSNYDGHHVTFYPAKITPRQLQVAVMLEAMPKLYNHWQTFRIFVDENWRSAKASFRLRSWHPLRRTKTTLITLVVRIWGWGVTRKMKRPIKAYLREIPSTTLGR
jgi:radical SAM superfamily enzyme YgiQ (UPF0313 family)